MVSRWTLRTQSKYSSRIANRSATSARKISAARPGSLCRRTKADSEIRLRRAERERLRREDLDQQYIEAFASRVRELYPKIPSGRELEIAEHACLKYSGRVGRSAAAKSFDEQAVRLAVLAHIRHRETNYDELLGQGWPRHDARSHVRNRVDEVAESWR